MSIWQFHAVVAASIEDGNALTEDEREALWDWIKPQE